MSLHDLEASNKPSILPSPNYDNLNADSRRLNQASEVIFQQGDQTLNPEDNGVFLSSFSVNNLGSVTLSLNYNNTLNDSAIIAFWQIQVWQSAIAIENRVFPYSADSNIPETYYNFIPPVHSLFEEDSDDYIERIRDSYRFTIYNNSGSNQTFYIAYRPRYIYNKG